VDKGGVAVTCPVGKHRPKCPTELVHSSFPLHEFEQSARHPWPLSCQRCKMPVDFCAKNGVNCTTSDVVTPFVWCQYLRPRDETNLCKDVVGRYLRTFEGEIDADNDTGMRDFRSPDHLAGVARWLGERSRKGVVGKQVSNLFTVFVEVIGQTVI
jgi:hypothetical protein